MADETTDCRNQEQLVICIRWVDTDYKIHKDPIGLVNISKTDAETISSALKDVLLRCTFPLENCKGQTYDGAANMMGKLNGVAKKIQQVSPSAMPIHCLAHCINLVLQDVAKTVDPIKDAFRLAKDVERLIKFSPKREAMFKEMQINESGHLESGTISKTSVSSIQPLCPTRWTVRQHCLLGILDNYLTLKKMMIEVGRTTTGDNGSIADGVANKLSQFSTFFGLELALIIFSPAEVLATTLQSKNITIKEAKEAALSVHSLYSLLRTEDKYNEFFTNGLEKSANKTKELKLPRYRKAPKRYDDGSEPAQFSTVQDLYRQSYYEALELAIGEISTRFDQSTISLLIDMEETILSAANGQPRELGKEAFDLYTLDIDSDQLWIQLQMFSNFLMSIDPPVTFPIKSIQQLCDVFSHSTIGRKMFSQIDIVLRIFLSIPATTASAERSFLTLRRLKTYLQNSMTQERLNNLMLLHVHKNRTDALYLNDIAQSFVNLNDNRRITYGSFTE